jgi:hypothetical protein
VRLCWAAIIAVFGFFVYNGHPGGAGNDTHVTET